MSAIQFTGEKLLHMKIFNKNLLLIALAMLATLPVRAQEEAEKPETVYRRSSLYPILLETKPVFSDQSEAELNAIVMKAYDEAPFPEKYNDHRLSEVSFKFKDYSSISAEELQKEEDSGKKKNGRKIDQKYLEAINKYLEEKDVARRMVAKWFNRKEDGSFDMSMIHDRGAYNASAMEVQLASGSIRGMAAIKDAGEELIKNSFVVINRMRFVKNEPIARATRDVAISIAKNTIDNQLAQMAAIKAAEIAYNAAKDGYSVWNVAYLYQLEWNDEIADKFYMDMWMDSTSIDPERKALFENTDIFKLNFVGYQKAKSLVLLGIGKKPEEILTVATVRNIDRVYVKLQKEYDVFKTKTPILSTDPIIAKIGMKEGVEGGDKFDVLEMLWDEKTGLTRYDKVGSVKVKKKDIWDNRYVLDVDDTKLENGDEEKEIKGTKFKGGGRKVMAGMLLRQVK